MRLPSAFDQVAEVRAAGIVVQAREGCCHTRTAYPASPWLPRRPGPMQHGMPARFQLAEPAREE